MNPGSLNYIWKTPCVARRYSRAVSLHSHTEHSRELLDFIPRYARSVPALPTLLRFQELRYRNFHEGRALNYSDAWWTPPLSALDAYQLERRQIEDDLGLYPIVSLTDHDSITAPLALHVLPELDGIPISLEWTVPYGASFFHLGVHNLPLRWAGDVFQRLAAYTAHPQLELLPELLSILHGLPSVLVVLNHPLWDEPGIGAALHRALLLEFLGTHREWIHELELNGLRPWHENSAVARLATEHQIPAISGGDRHGCEPNANLNLTRAATFSEFVSEVRDDKHSQVLFLAQYREPLRLRLLQGVMDVVRDYEDFREDRRRWTDRIFFRCEDGDARPLSQLWNGNGPAVVKLFVASVRLLGSSPVRSALQTMLAHKQEVPV